MQQLEFVYFITAEVACEPGDEDRIATEVAAIQGVRRVTCTGASVLATQPAPTAVDSISAALTMTTTAIPLSPI